MFSHELRECLKLIKTPHSGVYARDRMPVKVQTPSGIIVNTDPHTKPGTHWVAIYINRDRVGEFFDSYGSQPQDQFVTYLQRQCIQFRYSRRMLQDISSHVCGQYCVLFLYYRSLGVSMDKFLELFTDDTKINDTVVDRLFNELFNRTQYRQCETSSQSCCSRQRLAFI